MTRILGALALLTLAGFAQAQTVPTPCNPATPYNALCILFTPPTTFTNGAQINLPLTYRVEQRLGAGVWTIAALAVTEPRVYVTGLAAGDYTFRVFANCAGCVESDQSNVIARGVTAPPKPNPPTITFAVVVRVDAPPDVRVVMAPVEVIRE